VEGRLAAGLGPGTANLEEGLVALATTEEALAGSGPASRALLALKLERSTGTLRGAVARARAALPTGRPELDIDPAVMNTIAASVRVVEPRPTAVTETEYEYQDGERRGPVVEWALEAATRNQQVPAPPTLGTGDFVREVPESPQAFTVVRCQDWGQANRLDRALEVAWAGGGEPPKLGRVAVARGAAGQDRVQVEAVEGDLAQVSYMDRAGQAIVPTTSLTGLAAEGVGAWPALARRCSLPGLGPARYWPPGAAAAIARFGAVPCRAELLGEAAGPEPLLLVELERPASRHVPGDWPGGDRSGSGPGDTMEVGAAGP
jgi:hypothetical protein